MINLQTLVLDNCPTYDDGARLIKTQYRSNLPRIKARFLDKLSTWLQMNDIKNHKDITDFYEQRIKAVKEISYEEAFKLENATYRNEVFKVINISEMIENLGAKRIKTEGLELINKIVDTEKGEFRNVPLHQVYELHEVSGEKLGVNELIYCLKCWCTSTNKEHWLWIDTKIGKSGNILEAIASTCVVYKSMINKIKHIIRQGDVFLFEMTEPMVIDESEELVSLKADTYFKLLKSQS